MVRRREPKDEAYYERIRRLTAHLGLPIAPFVSPRDRERAWRDFRNMAPVVLPWWLWVVLALYGAALLGGIWLMATGHHVGAVLVLGWLIAVMVWHAISTVMLVRRRRDRTK
jgi:predicted lysophospholipase L1 biosynthesis ABC-type transport system permease subunit